MAAFKKKRPINANYSPFRFQLALIDCPVLIEALAVALGRINFCKLIKSGTGHAYRARSLCKRFPRNGETRAKRMNERTNERMNEWNEPIQRSPPPETATRRPRESNCSPVNNERCCFIELSLPYWCHFMAPASVPAEARTFSPPFSRTIARIIPAKLLLNVVFRSSFFFFIFILCFLCSQSRIRKSLEGEDHDENFF